MCEGERNSPSHTPPQGLIARAVVARPQPGPRYFRLPRASPSASTKR